MNSLFAIGLGTGDYEVRFTQELVRRVAGTLPYWGAGNNLDLTEPHLFLTATGSSRSPSPRNPTTSSCPSLNSHISVELGGITSRKPGSVIAESPAHSQ